jgi:molybdopterin molybdotransferase
MTDASGELKSVTRVDPARERLLEATTPHDRTDRVTLGGGVGRALAAPATAGRDVPGFDRAEADGYAVRAADTADASGAAPATLAVSDGPVGPGEAVPVGTGDALPDGADAVVPVGEYAAAGSTVEVRSAAVEGAEVTPAGGDVAAGERLFGAGHRLRPADCALLRAAGVDRVEAYDPPTVGVVPAGDGLVERGPRADEAVETNGLALARLADQWGAVPTDRNPVPAESTALRAAVERDLTKDVVVTTGLTGAGGDDVLPDVVADLGEVFVHGVAAEPARSTALGAVRDTPVVLAPGRPVGALVAASQFLRPALARAGGRPRGAPGGRPAPLARNLPRPPGVCTNARGRPTGEHEHGEGEENALPAAEPLGDPDGRRLSSVARADGWVTVPESAEGIAAGERVLVERWGWAQ